MNYKKKCHKIFISAISLCGLLLSASASHAMCPGFQYSLYGGGMSADIKKTKLVISPFETDTLAKGHSTTSFTPGAGIMYNFVIAPNQITLLDSVALGVTYYYFNTTHRGDVYLFENPSFNDFDYTMRLRSSRLMIDSEWNFQSIWNGTVIFGEAGVGGSRNGVKYHDQPDPGIVLGSIVLPSRTENKFAWQVGAGVKVPVPRNPQFLLSLRYLYADLGSPSTSKNGNIIIQEPVKVKLRQQSVLLGLTYAMNG